MKKEGLRNFIFLHVFMLTFLGGVARDVSALSTMDSILLGENAEGESGASQSDPLNYIFKKSKTKLEGREGLALYRKILKMYSGFYREGANLGQKCEHTSPLLYGSFDQKEQVKSSMVATLQYIGLDLTSRAIVEYAKMFEFDEAGFQNLVRRLVGNYCSENLTVISLRQLAKNLLSKFKMKDSDFLLPDFKDNPFFPDKMEEATDPKEAIEHEFLYTVKLFRAFCSWGGNVDDLRLLTPLVNSPFIMSFVIRQMTNKSVDWEPASDKIVLKQDKRTIQVFCENLICRKTDANEFLRKFPLSIGKISLTDDLSRMYCQEFKSAQYKLADQEKRVKKWILQQSLEEANFLVSHFIALLTGIPDLIVRSSTYDQLVESLRAPVDWEWDKWAQNASNQYSRDIYFEESVRVDKIDRKSYFDSSIPKFQVIFDINVGETDKIHEKIDKLEVSFPIKLSLKFLKWIRSEWIHRDHRWKRKNERLLEIFKLHIAHQVQKAKKKFLVPPWKAGMEKLIVMELLEQFELYSGKKFNSLNDEEIVIPIRFRYGPFALKYFHYRFRSLHGPAEIDI